MQLTTIKSPITQMSNRAFMTIMRIFLTVLYSKVNFMRTSLFCDPPDHLVSQFSACDTLLMEVVSMM